MPPLAPAAAPAAASRTPSPLSPRRAPLPAALSEPSLVPTRKGGRGWQPALGRFSGLSTAAGEKRLCVLLVLIGGACVVLGMFVDGTLCAGPAAAATLARAAPAAYGEMGFGGARLAEAACRAWALRNPAAAVAHTWHMATPEVFTLCCAAACIGLFLALRERFTVFWRVFAAMLIRLGHRALCIAALLAWTPGTDADGPRPASMWLTENGRLHALVITTSAMSRVFLHISGAVHLGLDFLEMLFNLAILWLASQQLGMEHLRSAPALMSAAAASVAVSALLAIPSLLRHAQLCGEWCVHGSTCTDGDEGEEDASQLKDLPAGPTCLEGGAQQATPQPTKQAYEADELSAPFDGAAQHFRDAHERVPDSNEFPVYTRLFPSTVRISIKIQGREPEELLADWQSQLQRGLQCEARVRSFAVRRGCTHVVLDVDQSGAAALLESLVKQVRRRGVDVVGCVGYGQVRR